MGNERRSYDASNHRIDHDQFEDVALVNYKEGTIKDFALSSTNPITPAGTVSVEVEGGGGGQIDGLPIFYHCRKGWFDSKVGNLKANKSLEFAPWGFRVGDKVVCMFRENQPVAVLGHSETPVYFEDEEKAPWTCNDIIRLQWHRTIGTSGQTTDPKIPTQDWWKNWFRYQGTWHCLHFRASTQELWKDFDVAPTHEGKGITLPHRARHIFGMKELRWGTIIWYSGDWLIVCGPIAYIFQVFSLGMPAPITGQMQVMAAVWTPEREEEWIAVGAAKEKEIGTGGGMWPHLYTEIPYPYMVTQAKFTDLLMKKLAGVTAYTPKWIVSEFWAFDHRRAASDPNTPNTPAG